MRLLLVTIAVLVSLSCASAQTPVNVPLGKPVLVDGVVEPVEWSDAYVRELSGEVRFYAKHSGDFLWLAVELPEGGDGAVDLYISPSSDEIYDLHASAKLGERKLSGGKWPDWEWWDNRMWVANVSRVQSFEQRTFLPTRAREYQVRTDKFPGRPWRVMFELSTPANPEWRTTVYPAGAVNSKPINWWTLAWNDSSKP